VNVSTRPGVAFHDHPAKHSNGGQWRARARAVAVAYSEKVLHKQAASPLAAQTICRMRPPGRLGRPHCLLSLTRTTRAGGRCPSLSSRTGTRPLAPGTAAAPCPPGTCADSARPELCTALHDQAHAPRCSPRTPGQRPGYRAGSRALDLGDMVLERLPLWRGRDLRAGVLDLLHLLRAPQAALVVRTRWMHATSSTCHAEARVNSRAHHEGRSYRGCRYAFYSL